MAEATLIQPISSPFPAAALLPAASVQAHHAEIMRLMASIEALGAARRQLDGAYRRAGIAMQPDAVWAHLGATPMIGQNDVAADEFGLGDAEAAGLGSGAMNRSTS